MGVASWGDETSPFRFTGRDPIERNDRDPTMASYTAGHLGFHGYMRAVDALLQRRAGVGVFDLPDRCWRDAYDDEIPPQEAVAECLEEEGWPGG
ncbi:hypothetical protein [Kozakia baliensis]|uniref:Uncharacterized protein n=1 Tax=Kozakia baliensis TaxID=153496 RepID=A0A1D8UYG1_9PROT|nr:hypothetical protein [Kozakia baliensis]AOX18652.1 hypothetical protein A0U89_15185 [Kozakia baliensis]GBR35057.1 hypothetical protein AA0488_2914 [Kozakia baliensis NRIC 0488]GEL65495.1 hypothetical protein KBA01_27810 [Kozakia baliensis]